MIQFTTEEQATKSLTLGDVKTNQFFVNQQGHLCQKFSNQSYISLATKEGRPCADYVRGAKGTTPIQRILPTVTKIEFWQ